MAQLGFLGAGNMGSAMASRLVAAEHDVVVWNRSPEALEPLVAAGAIAAARPEEALACPVSFSMLANDEATESTLTAQSFAGEAGRLHVVMASISPDAADRLSAVAGAADVRYLAAPVLGRPTVAAEGGLNILAAGDAHDIERARPFLDELGKRVWVLGPTPRTANVVKAAVNYDIIHAMQAIGESLTIVESEGVDADEFVELLRSTLFGGIVYTSYGQIIAERRYHPAGFDIALGLKDLRLAEDIATAAGVALPTAPVLRAVFETALADPELHDADWSAIAEVTRRQLPLAPR